MTLQELRSRIDWLLRCAAYKLALNVVMPCELPMPNVAGASPETKSRLRLVYSREDFANSAEMFLVAGVTMPSQIESGTLNPLQFSSNIPIALVLYGLPWIAGSVYR